MKAMRDAGWLIIVVLAVLSIRIAPVGGASLVAPEVRAGEPTASSQPAPEPLPSLEDPATVRIVVPTPAACSGAATEVTRRIELRTDAEGDAGTSVTRVVLRACTLG